MQINEYQKLAMRTAGTDNNASLMLNGVLGLCGETGEVSDIVKKHLFQGHDLDKKELAKELGDICWYLAVACTSIEMDLEVVMQMNIDKLKKRYPTGFTVNNSINREAE